MAKKITSKAASKITATPKKTAQKDHAQLFTLRSPGAKSVQLVGDFTQWEQNPIPLQKGPGDVWQTEVKLSPGRHHYRFVVDGEWRDDPECLLREPNPFGGDNMLRMVA